MLLSAPTKSKATEAVNQPHNTQLLGLPAEADQGRNLKNVLVLGYHGLWREVPDASPVR